MAAYSSLETAEAEVDPGMDFAETEVSNIDYTAAPTDENHWNPTYDLRRETQSKASKQQVTKKWRMLLCALLVAAVVPSAVAAGKYAMKAEPDPPVRKPPSLPKVKSELKLPRAKTQEPPPKPPLPPLLIETLTEPSFGPPLDIGDKEAKDLLKVLKKKPDVFDIKGFPVLREQLIETVQGRMMDASVLEVYSKLVQEHIDGRVSQNLQKDVVIIGPAMFSQQWQDYFMQKLPPFVPEELDIQRCKQASKVLIALPAPLGNAASGHFLLAVIDQERKLVSIVDSLPRAKPYYRPTVAFIKRIAEQLNGDSLKSFSVSRDIPARGFPVQAEGLKINTFFQNYIYNPEATIQDILLESHDSLVGHLLNSKLLNACGPMTLENILCIAENRVPNYRATDAMALRWRIVSELFYGLWNRMLLNGYLRSV